MKLSIPSSTLALLSSGIILSNAQTYTFVKAASDTESPQPQEEEAPAPQDAEEQQLRSILDEKLSALKKKIRAKTELRKKVGSRGEYFRTSGKKCNKGQEDSDTDVGVLFCEFPTHLCLEELLSSTGGVCAEVVSRVKGGLEKGAAAEDKEAKGVVFGGGGMIDASKRDSGLEASDAAGGKVEGKGVVLGGGGLSDAAGDEVEATVVFRGSGDIAVNEEVVLEDLGVVGLKGVSAGLDSVDVNEVVHGAGGVPKEGAVLGYAIGSVDATLDGISYGMEDDFTRGADADAAKTLKLLTLRDKLKVGQLLKEKLESGEAVEECTPGSNDDYFVDAGVLSGCKFFDHICMPDTSSSRGGICLGIDTDSNDHGVERGDQNHRYLTDHLTECVYRNGTSGFKCDKLGACGDLSEAFIQNNIGCGSCRAYGACRGLTGKFVNPKYYCYLLWPFLTFSVLNPM